ncbi:hypothetical protein, partial [Halomonas sp. NO4]|uniref:hypothetical protein n=1 Tax=Halomonas sp. NO4 TaxID=2484813 RepID=UPI001969AB34
PHIVQSLTAADTPTSLTVGGRQRLGNERLAVYAAGDGINEVACESAFHGASPDRQKAAMGKIGLFRILI